MKAFFSCLLLIVGIVAALGIVDTLEMADNVYVLGAVCALFTGACFLSGGSK